VSAVEVAVPLAVSAPRPVVISVGPAASTLLVTLESLADAHRDTLEQFAVTAAAHENVGNTDSARDYRHAAFNVRADLERLERIIEREIDGEDEPDEPDETDETTNGPRVVTHP
jgi:hypothetical protein